MQTSKENDDRMEEVYIGIDELIKHTILML